MDSEPIFDVAHLGHVELLTAKHDASVQFFTDVLGMEVVAESGPSTYLRCWGDYEEYSLKLTASQDAGVGHTALRAMSRGHSNAACALLRRPVPESVG
ncbi:VOC family protein [Alicyclobacillus fastidiosus]|uniref:VOC family protein n=1 Tax=Alicyclobacillus fastidiosus TaxID=392011 RepID=UPI0023E9D8DE|nr:hypothetical protein GCM10025859_48340 [Alicyclobacillus fastidiosus]